MAAHYLDRMTLDDRPMIEWGQTQFKNVGRDRRRQFWHEADAVDWDVVIVGGGIQGAFVYYRLTQCGLRVLLIDRGDFAAATSQASAMLIWGGLLYFRNREWSEVRRLCRCRDELTRKMPECVESHRLRYVFGKSKWTTKAVTSAAMLLYWLLGQCRKARPRWESSFDEKQFIANVSGSVVFEESRLRMSDAQFVHRWLSESLGLTNCQAVNYAEFTEASWEKDLRTWRIRLRDRLDGPEIEVSASCIINTAGVWAEAINARCSIQAPLKHGFSKGVSLCVPRLNNHNATLVFDDHDDAQGCSLVPWGAVSLWGSTESWTPSIADGFQPTSQEITELLQVLNRHFAVAVRPAGITSIRCGVRPLAVPANTSLRDLRNPLKISRRPVVWRDPEKPMVAVFGGKLTNAGWIANCVKRKIEPLVSFPSLRGRDSKSTTHPMETIKLCGLEEPVAAPRWCRDHTQCWTLEDYLRRRTNIAQWVPRCGLGNNNEFASELLHAAIELTGAPSAGRQEFDSYCQQVVCRHDDLILGASSLT